MALIDVFRKRKNERVGSSSLEQFVEELKLALETNTLTPTNNTIKLMKKAGVKPENYSAVYKQVVGLVFGTQVINLAHERYEYDPNKNLKPFFPQKAMVEACGAKVFTGQDSVVHQSVIEPSRKLIEYTYYKGKGLKFLEGEVKNEAYYVECNPQNLSDFISACKVVSGGKLESVSVGNATLAVEPVAKNSAMAGVMSETVFKKDALSKPKTK